MFNIQKRDTFQTVGDLRVLLSHLPAETRVCICGNANCFYHEEQDRSAICLDTEDLEDCYEEAGSSPVSNNSLSIRTRFLEMEIPCRLEKMLGLPHGEVNPRITQACITSIMDDPNYRLDFEWFDIKLGEVLTALGLTGRNRL